MIFAHIWMYLNIFHDISCRFIWFSHSLNFLIWPWESHKEARKLPFSAKNAVQLHPLASQGILRRLDHSIGCCPSNSTTAGLEHRCCEKNCGLLFFKFDMFLLRSFVSHVNHERELCQCLTRQLTLRKLLFNEKKLLRDSNQGPGDWILATLICYDLICIL